jgi:4-amino-4-deoxy-L-arabinose transferase-like glycosyltransferase
MIQSWHNFFFVAFDPGGFVTIDKPPLGFWFQAISAKILGYSGFSLLLPEALAGIGSVAMLYILVRRVFGAPAGLLAALFMALTPVLVATSRSNIIDSTLVFFMLLGAWAVSKAVDTGRLRWLILCAVLVGLGFNIKMLEAFLVVPAFGLMYLLGAKLRWRVKLLHLFLATIVLLSVSLSWAAAVDLTPASQRPWVDSTSTNSELDLALGYNGLERLLGQGSSAVFHAQPATTSTGTQSSNAGTATKPSTASATTKAAGTSAGTSVKAGAGATTNAAGTTAATTGTTKASGASAATSATTESSGTNTGATTTGASTTTQRTAPTGNGGGGGLFNNGAAGPLRLFGSELAGQASWLLPLALVGLLVVLSRKVRFPLDARQRATVLWGGWLLTAGVFYSVAGFFHSYYLVTMAPPIAALAAIAVVTLWRDYLNPTGFRLRAWALPVALLITAGTQAYMLSSYPTWSSRLTPIIVGMTVLVAGGLVVARFRPRMRRGLWIAVMAAGGMIALLLAPTAWAFDTVSNGNGGLTPVAGPSATTGGNGGGFGAGNAGGRTFGGGDFSFGGAGMGTPPTGRGTPPTGGAGITGTSAITGTTSITGTGGLAGGPGRIGGAAGGGGGQSSSVNEQLLAYLEKNQGTTEYLFAVTRSTDAAPYIIQTGKPVMALGGFSGSNPILTTAQLKALIKNNTVRFFLLGGQGGQGGSDSATSLVESSCKVVSSSAWQTSTTSTSTGTGAAGGVGSSQTLYDCGNLT